MQHTPVIMLPRDKINGSGLTLVPLPLYFSDGKVTVELALARGKKEYDRRETIKQREAGREMERAMKAGRGRKQ